MPDDNIIELVQKDGVWVAADSQNSTKKNPESQPGTTINVTEDPLEPQTIPEQQTETQPPTAEKTAAREDVLIGRTVMADEEQIQKQIKNDPFLGWLNEQELYSKLPETSIEYTSELRELLLESKMPVDQLAMFMDDQIQGYKNLANKTPEMAAACNMAISKLTGEKSELIREKAHEQVGSASYLSAGELSKMVSNMDAKDALLYVESMLNAPNSNIDELHTADLEYRRKELIKTIEENKKNGPGKSNFTGSWDMAGFFASLSNMDPDQALILLNAQIAAFSTDPGGAHMVSALMRKRMELEEARVINIGPSVGGLNELSNGGLPQDGKFDKDSLERIAARNGALLANDNSYLVLGKNGYEMTFGGGGGDLSYNTTTGAMKLSGGLLLSRGATLSDNQVRAVLDIVREDTAHYNGRFALKRNFQVRPADLAKFYVLAQSEPLRKLAREVHEFGELEPGKQPSADRLKAEERLMAKLKGQGDLKALEIEYHGQQYYPNLDSKVFYDLPEINKLTNAVSRVHHKKDTVGNILDSEMSGAAREAFLSLSKESQEKMRAEGFDLNKVIALAKEQALPNRARGQQNVPLPSQASKKHHSQLNVSPGGSDADTPAEGVSGSSSKSTARKPKPLAP